MLTALVNGVAVVAWAVTRTAGIAWIDGLEHSEPPQFTDTVCAALGAIAVVASVLAVARRRTTVASTRLGWSAAALGAVTVVALMLGANHVHRDDGHANGEEAAVGHVHGTPPAAAPTHHHDQETAARAHPHRGDGPARPDYTGRGDRAHDAAARRLRPGQADRPVRTGRRDTRATGVR